MVRKIATPAHAIHVSTVVTKVVTPCIHYWHQHHSKIVTPEDVIDISTMIRKIVTRIRHTHQKK